MQPELLLARAVLAIVFFISGVSKLLDLQGSRQALADFGVPAALARPVGIGLPILELLLAASLLPAVSAWYAAAAVLALLGVFVLAIAINLAQGKAPDCHCFGQLHSEPIGWPVLARNGVLASLAGFAVWQGHGRPGVSMLALDNGLPRSQMLLVAGMLAALAFICVFVWSVSTKRDGSKGVGLRVGSKAPNFTLPGLAGENHTLAELLAPGKPLLLLFTHPHCEPCQQLMPAIGKWQSELSGRLNVAVVSEGTLDDNRAKAAEHGIAQVLLQKKREIADIYQASATPAGVMLEPDGSIGSPIALGLKATWGLFADRLGIRAAGVLPALAAPGLPQGSPAPGFELPDLKGQPLSLDSLLAPGKPLLLAFINPDWPPSRELLASVGDWQRTHANNLKFAVLSTGNSDYGYEQERRGDFPPVLLQQKAEVAELYGVHGTPAAVAVQPGGSIGSSMALGADAIRELVSTSTTAPPLHASKRGLLPPPLSFKDLDGRRVTLRSFRGAPTVVLFWSPACGFCKAMLEDLKAWEANPPNGAPRALVISTGTVEANRKLGLRSTVVLDEGFRAGSAFGASGTPMALLLDQDGRIASDLVAGAPAVLQLAGASVAAVA